MEQLNLALEQFNIYKDQLTTPASLDIAFGAASQAAMLGWIAISLAPQSFVTKLAVRLSIICNCVLYAFFALGLFEGDSAPDLFTFPGVLSLFRKGPEAGLLAAWIHYLAFDLVVGYLIALDAAKNNISRILTAPFLFFTLMLGPVGLLFWSLFRGILGAKSSWLSLS